MTDISYWLMQWYPDVYELPEEIYGDMCCSDADYEDRLTMKSLRSNNNAAGRKDKKPFFSALMNYISSS